MELYQIRYFSALCQTLNFARAADKCGVSPPCLTRAVQKLERELGGVLIRRERRLTHLTELGKLVQPMLEEVLAHAETAKTAAYQFLSADEKPLRLGITPTVGPLRLAPFFAAFGAKYPLIEVALTGGDVGHLEEELLTGSVDVALATQVGPPNGRLRHHRLYGERVVVAFPTGHRFERQDVVRLIDLKGESLLVRTNCDRLAPVLDQCRKRGFQPETVHRYEREDWIQMMVAAGRGVALMPEYTHPGQGISARPLVEPVLQHSVSLVTVAGRPYDPSVQHFVRAMRSHAWEPVHTVSDDPTVVSRRADGISSCNWPRAKTSGLEACPQL
jgi:DNA-binding transcriptional LysR family regulator